MTNIFSDIGSWIDNGINWLTAHTICKLRGHGWKYLTGTYPMQAYCSRCDKTRKLTNDEVNEFNYGLHSYKHVNMNDFDAYLQGKKKKKKLKDILREYIESLGSGGQ